MTSNRETARFWLAQMRRQLEEHMSVKVIDARDGVPLEARCNICLRRWYRPEDDPTADTLADFAHLHNGMHRAR